MSATAKLSDLVESLEMSAENYRSYFDRDVGRVVSVEESILSAVEENNDAKLSTVPDWQKEEVEIARAIIADENDRFIDPPDKFEFNEYRHMQEFIGTVRDSGTARQLSDAIRGTGAFRRFKETLRQFNLLDRWYQYRAEAMKQFAIEWAEANDLPYENDLQIRAK